MKKLMGAALICLVASTFFACSDDKDEITSADLQKLVETNCKMDYVCPDASADMTADEIDKHVEKCVAENMMYGVNPMPKCFEEMADYYECLNAMTCSEKAAEKEKDMQCDNEAQKAENESEYYAECVKDFKCHSYEQKLYSCMNKHYADKLK